MQFSIEQTNQTPIELDAQCDVPIEEWVVLGSEKHRQTDEYYRISQQLLSEAVENSFIKMDANGRVWVHGPNEEMIPYHFEYEKKLYGIRIPASAPN
jgi:hypothetical protein